MKTINQQKIEILKRLITLNEEYQSLIKDYWIDIIPELNEYNINTLYGAELVINYLLEKNKGNLFLALKEFKGSEKNIYPVKESIKIYKELK